MNDDDPRPSGLSGEVPSFAARSMVSPGLQAALKASIGGAFRPLMAEVSKALLGAGLPKEVLGAGLPRPELGGFAKLAAGSMISPGLQAALKSSTDSKFRPLMGDRSKSVLDVAMPKALLGAGLPRFRLGAEFTKLVGGSMVSPGLQTALKASTDARFRPLMEGLNKSILGASLPRPGLGAEFAKLAARPVFNVAIDIPAGRTLGERARFTDLLGQVAKLPPAGSDGQAALADFAQRQAERQVAAYEADQAIVELRDQFEQLVTILQAAQQDQRHEARVNRRLAIATLAATILVALVSYLLPPRSATTPPTPTAPPPSVTSPSRGGSTPP
jgi:hypothetical protein